MKLQAAVLRFMKCKGNQQAIHACRSPECSHSPYLCDASCCECHSLHSPSHSTVYLFTIIETLKKKLKLSKMLLQFLQIVKDFEDYLVSKRTLIEEELRENTLSENDTVLLGMSSFEASCKISQSSCFKEPTELRLNDQTFFDLRKVFEETKGCLDPVWMILKVKRNPKEIFMRLNRKIQGRKNIQSLSINNVLISPIPQSFDLSNVTGLRVAVIDTRMIEVLGTHSKRIRKLQVYEEYSIRDFYLFEISKWMKGLTHLHLYSQNVTRGPILRLARNLPNLKNLTLFSNFMDAKAKVEFKKVARSCEKLSL